MICNRNVKFLGWSTVGSANPLVDLSPENFQIQLVLLLHLFCVSMVAGYLVETLLTEAVSGNGLSKLVELVACCSETA